MYHFHVYVFFPPHYLQIEYKMVQLCSQIRSRTLDRLYCVPVLNISFFTIKISAQDTHNFEQGMAT